MADESLYDRLGGAFGIAGVVDAFSDALIADPIVGRESPNPALREWHIAQLDRLPGLKFMRTLWVCNVAGGPFEYTGARPGATPIGLEEAHRPLRILPDELDRWHPSWLGHLIPQASLQPSETRFWPRSPPTRGR